MTHDRTEAHSSDAGRVLLAVGATCHMAFRYS